MVFTEMYVSGMKCRKWSWNYSTYHLYTAPPPPTPPPPPGGQLPQVLRLRRGLGQAIRGKDIFKQIVSSTCRLCIQ